MQYFIMHPPFLISKTVYWNNRVSKLKINCTMNYKLKKRERMGRSKRCRRCRCRYKYTMSRRCIAIDNKNWNFHLQIKLFLLLLLLDILYIYIYLEEGVEGGRLCTNHIKSLISPNQYNKQPTPSVHLSSPPIL